MAYRSTKEKFAAQAKARDLYVKDGLSLKEVSQQTGATLKTLRAWRNLGEWETMQEEDAKTDLDRLKGLRDSLLDRAEAQIKEGKLPHTEIGLMYKLEKMIDHREKKQGLPETVALHALRHFGPRMVKMSGELHQVYQEHLLEFGKWVAEQGFPRPPK